MRVLRCAPAPHEQNELKMIIGTSLSRTNVVDLMLRPATSDAFVGEAPMLRS